MCSSTSIQGSGLVSVGSCAQIASVHLGDASIATSAGPLLRTPPGRRDISSANAAQAALRRAGMRAPPRITYA